MKDFLKKSTIYLKGDQFLYHLNKKPRVLFWHGVDDICDANIESESYDTNIFTKQIEYLHQYFEIISLDEFYKRFRKNKFTKREIVLTFDDGYANNLYKVAPILNTYSIPFTIFISTDHIETGELYPTSINRLICLGSGLNSISVPSIGIQNLDISTIHQKSEAHLKIKKAIKREPLDRVREIVSDLINNLSNKEYEDLIERYSSVKPLNWDEVRELSKLGATIGSHCKYHICCHNNQSIEEVRTQITESKKIIEMHLDTECKFFAYPNGDYTEVSNAIVKEAGYLMGFSTERKNIYDVKDRAIIPRIGAPRDLNTFKLIINLNPY